MLIAMPLNYRGCTALKHTGGQHLGNAKKRQIERDKTSYPAMELNAKFPQMSTDNSLSQFGAKGRLAGLGPKAKLLKIL